MANFTGTNSDEIITRPFVSPTVAATGGTLTGGAGNDVAFLGAGNDVLVRNPGDESGVIEGQAGFDTLEFNGSNRSAA
jgi:Ca2+-binding RTX toxin-like protein